MEAIEYPEITLGDLSTITHSFHSYFRPNETVMRALIVRFVGVYRHGSAGNADARYMAAIAASGLEAWNPRALVFDFRRMKYEWGDRIEQVLKIGIGQSTNLDDLFAGEECHLSKIDIRTTIVVSHECRNGLESLVREEMKQDPRRWLFDNIDGAIAAIEDPQS